MSGEASSGASTYRLLGTNMGGRQESSGTVGGDVEQHRRAGSEERMNRRSARSIDHVILIHSQRDQAVLNELIPSIARNTLYRRVGKLLSEGALSKHGCSYRTTEHGKRRLAELTTQFDWNIWDRIYLPMQHLPSPQHRATLELTTAAVVARKAGLREDHHPGVVLMGPTLVAKTTAAKFECLLLGVAPGETIIDLTTESGRSLLGRRDGKGNLAFKRDLLDGPLIVFDDFLEAEASLRPSVHHFLSGRLVVPVDNTILRIATVSFITLNPRPKPTLEEQTSFSTAQLRRLVVTNLANVALPDLAIVGHHALEAAAKQGPLPLPPPTVNAETWRSRIVSLVREILLPQVWSRVDTEMIITMVTGMSAFITDPERAIQQTVYDYAITAETLGYTRLGWIEHVSRFSLHAPAPPPCHRDQEKHEPPPPEDIITIRRSAMEGYRESGLPPFVISDQNKARILAIASQENIPLEHADHALELILEHWQQQYRTGCTLDDEYSVLKLSKDLQERGIAVQDVKTAMRFRQMCREGGYTSEEFEAAMDLLPLLRVHGLGAQDDRIETVLGLAVRLLHSPRSLTELDAWLTSHQETRSFTDEGPASEQKHRQ